MICPVQKEYVVNYEQKQKNSSHVFKTLPYTSLFIVNSQRTTPNTHNFFNTSSRENQALQSAFSPKSRLYRYVRHRHRGPKRRGEGEEINNPGYHGYTEKYRSDREGNVERKAHGSRTGRERGLWKDYEKGKKSSVNH